MIKVSVILSFYKRLDYLKLLIAGFERQTFRDFEIIIADDGSPQDVTTEIEKLAGSSAMLIKHIWHQDAGFRKNKILNQAITFSDSDYLIFIDGDCVPHSAFVEEHFKNSSPGTCLTGRRVNLSEKLTHKLTEQKIKEGILERITTLLPDGIFGESYDVEKGLYIKNEYLRTYFNSKKRGLLGCNFSLHKSDMLNINGFDERYEAPSIGEDSDVQYRLELNRIKIKSLNNIAVQYHLYHILQDRPQANLDLFELVKAAGKSYTPFGIIKN